MGVRKLTLRIRERRANLTYKLETVYKILVERGDKKLINGGYTLGTRPLSRMREKEEQTERKGTLEL
jgi:hypothetical protein